MQGHGRGHGHMAGEDLPVVVETVDLVFQLVVTLAQLGKLGAQTLSLAPGLVEFVFIHQAAEGGQKQSRGPGQPGR
jgi:hypothetical protein